MFNLPLLSEFKVTGSSVMGAAHHNRFANNQDAFCILRRPDLIVSVLADGCSSGMYSEVGARLAANFTAKRLVQRLDSLDVPTSLNVITQDIKDFLNILIDSQPYQRGWTVEHMFLFTILGCVITPENTYIFGAGDGVYGINDEFTIIDQDNKPNYLAYSCVNPDCKYTFEMLQTKPTEEVNTILIGCDGAADIEVHKDDNIRVGVKEEPVGSLAQFSDPRYMEEVRLAKRLNILSKNNVLHDDTTLVIIQNSFREGVQVDEYSD